MSDIYLDLFYGSSQEELVDNLKKAGKYYDPEYPAGRKIKRSECKGIDCAWRSEVCE